jgi:hypothetical protein
MLQINPDQCLFADDSGQTYLRILESTLQHAADSTHRFHQKLRQRHPLERLLVLEISKRPANREVSRQALLERSNPSKCLILALTQRMRLQ